MIEKSWRYLEMPSPERVEKLCDELSVLPTIAKLLAQRGIESFDDAKHFFVPELSQLHDPFLMKDMDKAASRVTEAIEQGERLMIFGDYDVDGTTAVSLMYDFLKGLTPNLITYIPDRYAEGYGLSNLGLETAKDEGCTLVIALDCGIKAVDKAVYAKSLGLDLIVCDHHLPGPTLPDAYALLDPKRFDCPYPFKELSGCGVGFKLCQAIAKKLSLKEETWTELLDLLAVSIGADIVPIVGENRVLAHFGLKKINSNPRPAFAALLTGMKKPEFDIGDLVFIIGPRINAAGRMHHGKRAVQLLISDEGKEMRELTEEINRHNNERKEADKAITIEAARQVEERGEQDRYTTVVFDKNWHKGVIGIVASRLIENHWYRPTIVFTQSGDKLAGSARSVEGFNVHDALCQCEDLLEQFGGHMAAAGMTLKRENYEAFKERFEEVVRGTIEEDQRTPCLDIDCDLKTGEINPKFFMQLQRFSPFGPQNMAPVFCTGPLMVGPWTRTIGDDQKHLKLDLIDPKTQQRFDGIAFGMGPLIPQLPHGTQVQIAYHLEANHWNGTVKPQFRVLDIKPST